MRNSEQALRVGLQGRLARARHRSDEIFALVRPDALYQRPIPERHRLLFYLGHLEAFDWNLLGRDVLGREPFEARLDGLFAFGIDPLDGGLPVDRPADWPTLEEVRRYASGVRDAVDAILARVRLTQAASPCLERGWAIRLAIEHRLMHAETLAYLLHQLPFDAKGQGPAPLPTALAGPRKLVPIPRGCATLGLSRAAQPTLGWDNEYEAQRVDVPAFAIESHDVSCGEFLRFVQEGGYQEPSLWTDEDWAWRRSSGVAHPRLWVERAGTWRYRTMFAEVPLPLSWPVYVSHAEASAYARWAGRRLPSEAEFHRAAYGTPGPLARPYPWGSAEPGPRHGAFGFAGWDPEPIGSHPEGDSAFGVGDLLGNGWEWTRTPFAPFPGFEPLPFYPGYSADFFDGRHYVLKGGSPRTDTSLLRRTFRNWFQPHHPYVYATFRCVEERE